MFSVSYIELLGVKTCSEIASVSQLILCIFFQMTLSDRHQQG